jgi:anti-anti-sigma factor
MTVILNLRPTSDHIVRVKSSFSIPASRTLRHRVRALLRKGERRIVLDLSAVTRIDAAGIGELIRVFNMTAAVNGGFQVVNATAWVREILERAHLFALLSGGRTDNRKFA